MEKKKLLSAEDDQLLASLLTFSLQKGGYGISVILLDFRKDVSGDTKITILGTIAELGGT